MGSKAVPRLRRSFSFYFFVFPASWPGLCTAGPSGLKPSEDSLVGEKQGPKIAHDPKRILALRNFRAAVSLELHPRQQAYQLAPGIFLNEKIAHVHVADL